MTVEGSTRLSRLHAFWLKPHSFMLKSIFGLFTFTTFIESSLPLTILSNPCPDPPDAGRAIFPSRFRRQPCGCGIRCQEVAFFSGDGTAGALLRVPPMGRRVLSEHPVPQDSHSCDFMSLGLSYKLTQTCPPSHVPVSQQIRAYSWVCPSGIALPRRRQTPGCKSGSRWDPPPQRHCQAHP